MHQHLHEAEILACMSYFFRLANATIVVTILKNNY
jgi:hypothetical protein